HAALTRAYQGSEVTVGLVRHDDCGADGGEVPHEHGVGRRLTHTSAGQRLTRVSIALDGHTFALRDLGEPGVVAERTVGEPNHDPHADVGVGDVAGERRP